MGKDSVSRGANWPSEGGRIEVEAEEKQLEDKED